MVRDKDCFSITLLTPGGPVGGDRGPAEECGGTL